MKYTIKQLVSGHKVTTSNLNRNDIVYPVSGYSVYAEVLRQQAVFNEHRVYVCTQCVCVIGLCVLAGVSIYVKALGY
jgi:hypothetical protein